MDERATALLERIRAARGYVLPTHEFLAGRHPEFLEGYDAFFSSAMSEASPLSRREREFVLMAADMALGADPAVVRGHVKRAIEHGATDDEVLAVVELTSLAFTAKAVGLGVAALREDG